MGDQRVELLSVRVSVAQNERFNKWLQECRLETIERLKAAKVTPSDEQGAMWAIGMPGVTPTGDELSFEISPSSITTVVKVRYTFLDRVLDLTDYEEI